MFGVFFSMYVWRWHICGASYFSVLFKVNTLSSRCGLNFFNLVFLFGGDWRIVGYSILCLNYIFPHTLSFFLDTVNYTDSISILCLWLSSFHFISISPWILYMYIISYYLHGSTLRNYSWLWAPGGTGQNT